MPNGCVTDSFGNWRYFFCLSVNCLFIYLFFVCLVSVDFFCNPFFFFRYILPCFFVNFWGLSLPCHLLCCLLFVYFCVFFFLMDFLGGVSLTALGTSSLRLVMFPWGLVALRLRFEDGYRRVVSYTIDDLGKRVAWLTRIDEHGTSKKRLTMGWEDDAWTRGGVRLLPPGWSWLDDLGDGINCFVFFFIFWKTMGIAGKVLEWKKGSLLNCCWVGGWIPQCFPKHYSCYDTDRTAEITDAPTS